MQQHQKALIMVDVQKAFEHEKWGERNNLDAEKNISRLLTFWREKGWTVIHIQHTSDQPHSLFHPANEGHSFKEIAKPLDEETVIQKKVNSSFIGTKFRGTTKIKRDRHCCDCWTYNTALRIYHNKNEWKPRL